MKRLLGRFSVLLFLLLSLTARGQAVEITILHGWGTMEGDHVAMRRIYQEFEQVVHGVTLRQIALPDTDQALAKAADMLAIGEAPDLLFTAGVYSPLVDFMITKGYALDLTPYLAADDAFFRSVSPLTLDGWKSETGALFTISDVLWLNGLWENAEILYSSGVFEAPRTWEEFFASCDAVLAESERVGGDIRPIAMTKEDAVNLFHYILAGTEGKNDVARALEVLARVFSYTGQNSLTYEYRDTLSLFNEGKAAFYINGIWASSLISEDVNALCVPFPGDIETVSGQTAQCGYIVGDNGDPERAAACVAFLKYMLSAETQAKILAQTGQFPANPEMRLDGVAGVSQRFLSAARNIRGADAQTVSASAAYGDDGIERMLPIICNALLNPDGLADAETALYAILNQ